ncbi:DNase I-like protein, partial [Lentinus brumalis]
MYDPRASDPLRARGGTHNPQRSNDRQPHNSTRRPAGRRTRTHLKIATLNMRGYGEGRNNAPPDKWLCINQVVRDGKIAIMALQESHLTPERRDNLNNLFGATLHVLASYDPTNARGARGVAFALNKRLVNVETATLKEIEAGRAAILTLPWTHGRTLNIMNIYAPNEAGENQAFWERRTAELVQHQYTSPDILLGDFNIVEEAIDRLPPRQDPPEAVAHLRKFRETAGLTDGWRRREPTTRMFTYLQASTGSQSRIDRIYVSRRIMQDANEWEACGPGLPTDHRMVTAEIVNLETPYMGKGRWAMPQSLLTDKKFLDKLHEEGMKLAANLELCNTREAAGTPQKLFALFKTELSKIGRQRAKQTVPRLDRQISSLRTDLAASLNDDERPDVAMHAAVLQDRLTKLEIRRFGQKRRAVATNDWAKGETICRYWTKLNAAPMPS